MARTAFLLAIFLLATVAKGSLSDDDFQIRIINPWTDSCGIFCEIFAKFWGYPNVGGFNSVQAGVSPSSQASADLLSAVVSTIGLPSVYLAYLKSQADWNFNINWDDMSKQFNASASVSVAASAYGAGFAFRDIFEFSDTDGDGKYTPGVDRVESTYNFASPLQCRWDMMHLTSTKINSDVTLYKFNATTLDQIFSIQWWIATGAYRFPDTNAFLSPNGTKIDIRIQNYPFTKSNTYLGLTAILASGDASAQLQAIGQTSVNVGDLANVQWVGYAEAQDAAHASAAPQKVDVQASAMYQAGIQDIAASVFSASVAAQASWSVKKIYYSFSHVRPTYVYWDPSVGFGPNNASNNPSNSNTTLIIVLVVVGVALLAAGAAFVVYRDRKRAQQSLTQPILSQKPSYTNA